MKRPHPSGRPDHSREPTALNQYNIPPEGFLTPRLKQRELKDAIGFGVNFTQTEDDECL